ncbi:MAG: glycosyltransferase family 39 protein [Candidatus Aminicenantes bacterium]|nr:MAG: glycosyltransferase family 39 protein [Candidatus Aminicenantes bacterium]
MNVKKFVEKINVKQILEIGVYLLLFLLLIGEFIPISYGIENVRLMQIFSTDEASAVRRVLVNLEYDDLDPRGFYHYGYFYHTVCFYMIKLLESFGFKADAMLVAIVFRLISWFSYILVGIVIYKTFTLHFKGRKEFGLILVLLLLSLPGFAFWSRFVHPDMLQVLLILLAVLVAFSAHEAMYIIMASAIAGIAFGTKYSGIFVLPFLFLPYILHAFITSPKTLKFWFKVISVCILAVLIFLTLWVVTNPYVLKNYNQFQADFLFEKKHVSTGHGKVEPQNPLLWFPVLWNLFGPVNSIVVGVGVLTLLVTLIITIKRDKIKKFLSDPGNRNLLTIILYIITSFVYLMLEVRMREPRYLFHILPFILLIAIYSFQKISTLFKSSLIKHIIIIGLFVSALIPSLQSISKASISTWKYKDKYIKAGNFLAENEPGELRILAASYSYVPPKFKHVIFRFWIDEEKIKKYSPDIVILNAKASRRWSWKRKGTSFRDLDLIKGKFANAGHFYRFHKKIFSPGSPWEIIYETNNIVILKKKRSGDLP